MSSLPNLFIIGAPKSGTTSLAHYLAGHPDVFMSDPKEPLHYNTDIHHVTDYGKKADYMKLFREAGPRYRIVAEASVWYLYSRDAVPRILADVPHARFIVMLRNPVDMARSLHDQMLYSGKEVESDFMRAWWLQSERRAGFSVPKTCEDVKLILYRDACAIGTQLERVMALVNHERLHVIYFDDLASDPRRVWLKAQSFLGLSDDGRSEFPVLKSARAVRYAVFKRALDRARSVKKLLGIGRKRTGLLRPFAQWNTIAIRREPLSAGLHQEILDEFLDEIEKLESLTRRDLGVWKTVP